MTDSEITTEVRKMWKRECSFLPMAVLLAAAVGLVVWRYRLDQGPQPFAAGVVVGALGACAIAVFVYVIRLGTAVRGRPTAGLFVDAVRLARGK